VQWQQPDEWRLDAQLRGWGQAQPIACEAVDSEHFLTARDTLATQMRGRRQWLMETFYRQMRQRWGVLLDTQGQPEGGRWNLDHNNRQPWPGHPPEPADHRTTHNHGALWALLQEAGVRSFGNPDERQLRWPLNRQEALACLDHFIKTTLPHFGPHEDAMSSQAPRLFHSLLSFALNVKMLHPLEVVQKAEAAYREGRVPLASAEGFIRQILGWREYVRGIYWAHMPGYEEGNALGQQQALPRWFWTGQTRMRCLSACITQSLETAHAHHIQRLMVIGNFALLAGLQPQALHRWYLGIYIDAFEWVELPNTLGMSQGADGGTVATKPYVSSAAYIHRMSDYCRQCTYDRKEKTSANACPFNALYWDFFDRHAERLRGNHRLAPVYRQLGAMAPALTHSVRVRASQLREQLDEL
jgi:deoxyribodipyrimidine photolyase-related protein